MASISRFSFAGLCRVVLGLQLGQDCSSDYEKFKCHLGTWNRSNSLDITTTRVSQTLISRALSLRLAYKTRQLRFENDFSKAQKPICKLLGKILTDLASLNYKTLVSYDYAKSALIWFSNKTQVLEDHYQ